MRRWALVLDMAGASRGRGARPGPGDPAGTAARLARLTIRTTAAGAGWARAEQVESWVTVAAPEAVTQPGDLPAVVLGLRIQVAEQAPFESGQT